LANVNGSPLTRLFRDHPSGVSRRRCDAASRAVAAVIARVWTDDIRLVVSSDLSHFESYHTAHRHDERTAMTIEPLDAGAIGPSDACGHLAIQDTLR
jgi:MEMO1 family protein